MKQKLHDILSRMQRERERDLRNYKKMEMQLKIAQEGLELVKAHHERLLLEVCIISFIYITVYYFLVYMHRIAL